ncbi:MAG: acetolactate synthase [Phycisphaerae bacterium]|nr:acetolactate synthase [Phycisphaerae bacterium]
MAHQLTIFLENRPGRVQSISKVLVENNMNIWAFTIQDRGEFGLIKMIVDKPKQAQLVLTDMGFACAIKEVLAVSAADAPGNLAKLTGSLLAKNVNIKDAYGFVALTDRKGICFLEFENPDSIDLEETIAGHGFTIMTDEQLYEL